MRLRRDDLVFRALVVLDEAVEACHDAPIQPSLGVRFALMFLFAVGRGDRSSHDAFWRELQEAHADAHGGEQPRYFRTRNARMHMTGIARSAGVELSAEYLAELRVARMPDHARREYRENEARLAQHRQRLRDGGQHLSADDQTGTRL